MFDKGNQKYGSDIKLGERYEDPQTGIAGVATSIHFYQYACERVTLEFLNADGELQENTLDSPRLEHVESKERARATRTGGPGSRHESARGVPAR